MRLFQDLAQQLRPAEVWLPAAQSTLRVLLIVVLAWAVSRIVGHFLRRLHTYAISVMERRGEPADRKPEKRAATIIAVLRLLIGSIVWLLVLVMALTELGFKIEPRLASLSVAGLALGLGARTLIKDWLGGLLLLLEDQIRIGDFVTINGFCRNVREINRRTTVLRAENGAVHIIADGSITVLSNFTREYSYYIFETILAHRADANRASTDRRRCRAIIAPAARLAGSGHGGDGARQKDGKLAPRCYRPDHYGYATTYVPSTRRTGDPSLQSHRWAPRGLGMRMGICY